MTGTKDLQQVNLTFRVLHRPDVEHLSEIHTNLGPDYAERVLPSIGNEVLKATVAQFNADQLLTPGCATTGVQAGRASRSGNARRTSGSSWRMSR